MNIHPPSFYVQFRFIFYAVIVSVLCLSLCVGCFMNGCADNKAHTYTHAHAAHSLRSGTIKNGSIGEAKWILLKSIVRTEKNTKIKRIRCHDYCSMLAVLLVFLFRRQTQTDKQKRARIFLFIFHWVNFWETLCHRPQRPVLYSALATANKKKKQCLSYRDFGVCDASDVVRRCGCGLDHMRVAMKFWWSHFSNHSLFGNNSGLFEEWHNT